MAAASSHNGTDVNRTADSQMHDRAPGSAIPVDDTARHYELPNLTQLLYDFTNKEHDMIMSCFRTGNYASLRDLPNELSQA